MAVVLRAMVLLAVLVGLPSAWVYYGPLPAGAQALANRVAEIAKSALLGDTVAVQPDPRLGEAAADQRAVADDWQLAQPVRYQPDRTLSKSGIGEKRQSPKTGLREQLEPHLSVLRKLGASEYTLEDWGRDGQLVRFRCAVSMGEGEDFIRQFEVVAADSLVAVRQVVGEVSSWQNARGMGVLWK
ncbi:MAG: hypothetical protein MK171_00640 [Pirellulales bacterium]|nr:hypothetical protein [Pirellulales bacterium]